MSFQELFLKPELAKRLVSLGFKDTCIPGYPPTFNQTINFLISKFVDVYVITDCTTNEILGYRGIVHVLLDYPLNEWTVQADTYEDNFNRDLVMNKTIESAIEFLEKRKCA